MQRASCAALAASALAAAMLAPLPAQAEIRGGSGVQTFTSRFGAVPIRGPILASAPQTVVIIERQIERVPVWPTEPVTVIGIRPAPTPDPVIHTITPRGVVTRHVGGTGPRIITRDGDIIRSNAPEGATGGPRIIEIR